MTLNNQALSHERWSLQVDEPGSPTLSIQVCGHSYQGCARPTAPHSGRLGNCRPPFFPLLVSPAHSMLHPSFCCQGLQLTFISLSFHPTHACLSERWSLLPPASSEQFWARVRAQSRPQGRYCLVADSEPRCGNLIGYTGRATQQGSVWRARKTVLGQMRLLVGEAWSGAMVGAGVIIRQLFSGASGSFRMLG